jgi:hypothetical protein
MTDAPTFSPTAPDYELAAAFLAMQGEEFDILTFDGAVDVVPQPHRYVFELHCYKERVAELADMAAQYNLIRCPQGWQVEIVQVVCS